MNETSKLLLVIVFIARMPQSNEVERELFMDSLKKHFWQSSISDHINTLCGHCDGPTKRAAVIQ